ncbi:MAG TPA: hypothetical protein VJR58_34335 [Vineibacter sp.]|nr:hypothetical protein [Vineibacter sp.]
MADFDPLGILLPTPDPSQQQAAALMGGPIGAFLGQDVGGLGRTLAELKDDLARRNRAQGLSPTTFSPYEPRTPEPSWWERRKSEHSDYIGRGGLLGTLFSMLPSETQASLQPWAGMANPLEWTPGAGIRDAVQAWGDTARAVGNLDPWGTLAGVGYMGLGLLSAVVPPLRQPGKIAAPARAPAQNASKNVNIYDPPTVRPRPFEADNPKGARADDSGRITHDIEGRELIAPLVVGRRMVGMGDSAFPKEELNALGTSLTGRRPQNVTSSKLRGDAGRYVEETDPLTGNRSRAIFLNRDLIPQQAGLVLGHEVGHAIAKRAAKDIPTTGMVEDLRRIYNDLNTSPQDWRMQRSARDGVPVKQRYWTSPESQGYSAKDVSDELWAEAIRAYMTDPNYLKATSRKVAAPVRQSQPHDQPLYPVQHPGGAGDPVRDTLVGAFRRGALAVTLITDAYREQNRALHASNEHYGTSGKTWAPKVRSLADWGARPCWTSVAARPRWRAVWARPIRSRTTTPASKGSIRRQHRIL